MRSPVAHSRYANADDDFSFFVLAMLCLPMATIFTVQIGVTPAMQATLLLWSGCIASLIIGAATLAKCIAWWHRFVMNRGLEKRVQPWHTRTSSTHVQIRQSGRMERQTQRRERDTMADLMISICREADKYINAVRSANFPQALSASHLRNLDDSPQSQSDEQ